MIRTVRLVVAAALLGAAATTGLAAVAAPVPCAPGGTTEDVGGSWLALRPSFPAGGPEVTLVAAPAFDPNLLWATNGTVLARSEDAGCGWDPVWSVTSVGNPSGTTAQITALQAPSSANSSQFVYVGVTTTATGSDPLGVTPWVAVSDDRGKTFTVSGVEQGLPPVGTVQAVAANPQVPQVAYAVIAAPGLDGRVFATSDTGATWASRTSPGGKAPGTALAVHPTTPTELYGLADDRVQGSSDGGANFSTRNLSTPVSALSITAGGGGVQLVAAESGRPAVSVSGDRGATWRSQQVPITPSSVAGLPVAASQFAVADDKKVYVIASPRQAELSPDGDAPVLSGASAPTATGFSLTGLREGVILQLTVDLTLRPVQPTVVNGVPRPVSLLPRGRVRQFPATLSPPTLRVALPAGFSREIPYSLLLPRTPPPVDLMFLLDSTGSMTGVFDALKKGVASITNALDGAGLNAQFGLGDFRDYPDPYGPAGRGDWPYRLDRAIGPSGPEFEMAINRVSTGGGTSDSGDSPLPALVQSTTGAGDRLGERVFVEPGQQAGYRPEALKIAVLAYDTKEHYGGQRIGSITEPGPTFESTIATLREYGVHAMGLSIGETPLPAMARLAEGSDTLAPDGGVDCNADGSVDVAEGNPLVCLIPAELVSGIVSVGINDIATGTIGVAPAVVSLATGIPDRRQVTLSLSNGGKQVRLLTPATSTVNVRADNALDYTLSLRCPVGPASRRVVALSADTAIRHLASATLTLDCAGIDGPAELAPPAAVAGVAAAPAAPGQPAPNINPNPNPNVNPNAQPNVNTNPGMAGQEESQAQLALAQGDQAPKEQLEMSAAFVGTAGLLLCAATVVHWRRREQEQLA